MSAHTLKAKIQSRIGAARRALEQLTPLSRHFYAAALPEADLPRRRGLEARIERLTLIFHSIKVASAAPVIVL